MEIKRDVYKGQSYLIKFGLGETLHWCGATTINKMTLRRAAFGMITIATMPFRKMTFNIRTLNISTLSLISLVKMTLRKIKYHNNTFK